MRPGPQSLWKMEGRGGGSGDGRRPSRYVSVREDFLGEENIDQSSVVKGMRVLSKEEGEEERTVQR